ncbi:MAG: OmpA family protein [Phycisphaerales bacterium]|nr:OmpA family protein [Phycisphaerales bacterium]
MKITHRIARGRTIALTTLLVAVAGLGTGCVSQQEYDRLYETNQSLRSQNADLQNRLGTLESNNSQLQGSAGDAQGVIGRLRSENTTLRDQLAASQNAFASLEDRMNSMSIVQLDPATDRALSDLASQYPDMIVYDGESGMLRFVSDLTFASGSDQVQPSAMDSLKTLASVLSSNTASKYDLRIVGHTDDEKPGANTRRNHPTNVHLSAHRAISVRKALGDAGLDWSRMSVTGWGEYRPIVANNPGKGTAANRRVEIYLVPSTRNNLSVSPSLENATSNTPSTPVDTRPKIDPTK